jgi:8-oxo-dGTP pyrophosphatase MutT (NUDIX family)
MTIETSCGFLLVNSDSDKILILKQSTDFEWGLPKGHQEEGEELIDAAFREVQEEVSIGKDDISTLRNSEGNIINFSFDYKSPVSGNTRRIVIFLGLTKKNPLISKEHCGFACVV